MMTSTRSTDPMCETGRRVRSRSVAAAVLLALVVTAAPAAAQTAARKFGRGVAAMTTGFLEVPGNMIAETHALGPAEGVPVGFLKGLGMIVVREPVGVYEALTAPFPAPPGYEPVIRPEFPWSYFEGDGSRVAATTRDQRAH